MSETLPPAPAPEPTKESFRYSFASPCFDFTLLLFRRYCHVGKLCPSVLFGTPVTRTIFSWRGLQRRQRSRRQDVSRLARNVPFAGAHMERPISAKPPPCID